MSLLHLANPSALDLSSLAQRNTTPRQRLIHLIKHAYLIAPDIKTTLLQTTYKAINTNPTPNLVLHPLMFWEILKHFQKNYTQIYITRILPNIHPHIIDIYNKLLYTHRGIFPARIVSVDKTTLYTFPQENVSNLKISDILPAMSVHISLVVFAHRELQRRPIPLYIIDNLLLYQLFFRSFFADSSSVPFKAIVPIYYVKHIKSFLVSKHTMLALAQTLNSKKRAKKYLRILHKRLGFYPKRKVPWKTG